MPRTKCEPLDARAAAHSAVERALCGRGFAVDWLRSASADGRLDRRESALATQLALGALRHVVTIDALLGAVARFERRRVAPPLRTILYVAAFQVIWLDRIPVFAAVDEAVSAARRAAGDGAARMVNAVLRRLAASVAERRTAWQRLNARHVRTNWTDACAFNRDVLPPADDADHHLRHLAAATGERIDRYRALVRRLGVEPAEQVAWAVQATPAIVLQRNTLRIGSDEFAARCRAEFGERVDVAGDAAFLADASSIAESSLFINGDVHVQDCTAHAAAMLLDARPGERILDFCAAPGGKAVVLAQCMRDDGAIVACDTDDVRLARVADNAQRLGLASIRCHWLDREASRPAPGEDAFDAAIVDVPCSNSGVLARRPEARLGLSARKLASLAHLQIALLRRAAAAVRPGGRLVYCTCSIEPCENQAIVAALVRHEPQWRIALEVETLPSWGPRPSAWRDGGYAARLTRLA
jgi:16S rRNA (cytosine967-C5)-methyltransferase